MKDKGRRGKWNGIHNKCEGKTEKQSKEKDETYKERLADGFRETKLFLPVSVVFWFITKPRKIIERGERCLVVLQED